MTTVKTGQKTILLSPLDWGLGHTTRCIPLISTLLAQGCRIIVATDGKPEAILRQHFGDKLQYERLPGYRVHYSRRHVFLSIIRQLPGIRQAIRYEQQWLKRHIGRLQPNAIISDNRYGFYHASVPSVILTHQLQLQLPAGWKAAAPLVQFALGNMLEKFSSLWVPDFANNAASLAGELSHPLHPPAIPLSYIGHISQLPKAAIVPKDIDILAILSGPEPQRTVFEQIILAQHHGHHTKLVLVRGIPNETHKIPAAGNVEIIGFAGPEALATLVQRSRCIICRSGYSSLMDFLPLGAKCILIPTPGQTEQEYLAENLRQKQMAITTTQASFDLPTQYEQAQAYNFKVVPLPETNIAMQQHVVQWLQAFS